ncbi:MAG: TIGR03617 family F420-dependent LLM class oxidoreductase [Spongiibacteraceae bacterium]
MKIDGPFYATMDNAAAEAKRLAAIGYDGIYTLEGAWDPFFPLALASEHAPELDIATAIAVAFPRNPSHIAYQAWDLQKFSKGRFSLGVGSQIKAHIEKRFGIDFSPPAARMREYILAVKAFFDCWQNGTRLDFQGKYYRHTLMTQMFNPGPNPYGVPPIMLGALGPKMTEVAGEVADGLIVHPFNSTPFLREQALPAVRRGLEKSAKTMDDFCLQVNAMVITGDSDEEYHAAEASVKSLLGFYASTPAYRPPMDAVGLGDLQPKLNALSKQGKWDELGNYINEEFVDAFCTRGKPSEIAAKLKDKYGDCADRLAIYAPYATPDQTWANIIRELKS